MSTNLSILEVTMEMAFPGELLDQVAKQFGPQTARECAMSTSVGGIGPLLKDRVYGQHEIGIDVTAVSLLYEKVWVQSWHEWGQLNLEKHNVGEQLRKVLRPTSIRFNLEMFDGTSAEVTVWQWNYGGADVYFLSCPQISESVYPGPKDAPKSAPNPHVWAHELKLKQSWLLGRGALELCKQLNKKPNFIVMSETPTLFAHNRLVQDSYCTDPFFSDVSYVFNDHTPLEYAHPIWDQHTIDLVKLDPAIYQKSTGWTVAKKTLDITSMMVQLCDGVFGVARKHGDVMRNMSSLKEYDQKIQYITNGIRKQDWQASELSHWETLSDEDLVRIKLQKKKELLDWAWRACRLWSSWAEESLNKKIIVLTRRITPYKRLDILVKLLEEPQGRERFIALNTVIFVGGRIHQQDNHAQDIVYDLLELLEKDEVARQRIIFVDNFNIWEAHRLYKGADASIMMADDTREASATGFMKAQVNGAIIIATSDGAIPEFVRFDAQPKNILTRLESPSPVDAKLESALPPVVNPHDANGFLIPYIHGEPTAKGLIEALEAFSATYDNLPKRIAMIRSSLAYTPILDIARTAIETKEFFENILSKKSPTVR